LEVNKRVGEIRLFVFLNTLLSIDTLRGIFPSKTMWSHEEVFVPNFHRAEGFNETYHPLGWHHSVATVYHEAGGYLGYYGMWRTADQRPFSPEDIAFLRASAPHIAHGLRSARLLATGPEVEAAGGFAR
jgi:hypothetical protein